MLRNAAHDLKRPTREGVPAAGLASVQRPVADDDTVAIGVEPVARTDRDSEEGDRDIALSFPALRRPSRVQRERS